MRFLLELAYQLPTSSPFPAPTKQPSEIVAKNGLLGAGLQHPWPIYFLRLNTSIPYKSRP
ncbi:hypothetical protein C8Q76DRAFT_761299 [Earliella scabrosa]|nr:hypothetical protein C8Q76DRAFT_761299 [Earliella scabrosa]